MDLAGWEQLYRTGERGKEEEPSGLLVETVANLQPGAAIDLACGTGRNALYLARLGWKVTALDGSETAIRILKDRAAKGGLNLIAEVGDLTSLNFSLPSHSFDLAVIAYYLQRDLYAKVAPALRKGGLILAIAHTPEADEEAGYKRAAPGEMRRLFTGWEILHDYEGPSRDPAHRKPVAEIVARKKS
jgi:tellurite methyltransferase